MYSKLRLEVVTPERQAISLEVDAVVLPGEEGSLGILPGHMSLVTSLKPGMLKYQVKGEEQIYALGGGYAEITPQKIVVLADTAEPAEEINLEAAAQARVRAMAELKRGLQGADLEATEMTLKKALAQLKVADLIRRRQARVKP